MLSKSSRADIREPGYEQKLLSIGDSLSIFTIATPGSKCNGRRIETSTEHRPLTLRVLDMHSSRRTSYAHIQGYALLFLPFVLAKIDRSNWSCQINSFQTHKSNNWDDCATALDEDSATFWHTLYVPHNDILPHNITIDMVKQYNVTKMTYLPRQDGSSNGNIGNWNIFLRNETGPSRLLWGNWTDDQRLKTVN